MCQNINITEAGRKYLQLYNIPTQPTQRQTCPTKHALPSIISQPHQPHEAQLHSLAFRLNNLYKSNVINEAKAQLNQNIFKIREDLLKDLGYSNQYTSKRANQLIAKIVREKSKVKGESGRQGKENGGNVGMELSKSKNYLARINYLHGESKNKFENIRRQIQKAASKEYLD